MAKHEKKSKIKISKTKSEWVWDIFGYGVYLGSIIFLIYNWNSLPNQVPAHFNAAGEVDRWGSKYELLTLPIIGAFIAVLMQFVEKYPETHNYPKRLNEKNAKEFYLISRKTSNSIKNISLIVFAFIVFESISIAMKWGDPSGKWFIPLIVISVTIPIVIGFVRQRKIR